MQNSTPYVFILPALIKSVHFSNVNTVCIIPNLNDLLEENLLEEIWWTPQDRANFRKEAAREASKEYAKLSLDERKNIRFDRFAKDFWGNYDPAVVQEEACSAIPGDVSLNSILFLHD
jgi:hypothetical protein